jgi:hypothetical protein
MSQTELYKAGQDFFRGGASPGFVDQEVKRSSIGGERINPAYKARR